MPAAAEFSAAVAFIPCCSFSRRENARRSFAPRSCGTIAHSLIFAPRRRLPPPLFQARQFSLKTHGNAVGFLLLCLRLLFASRKCKTFFRSSFLRNYRSFSHFCSAEAASAAAVSRKAIFAQNPWQRRGFLALMPAPAFRVAKMLDVLSLPKKSIIQTKLTSRPARNINPPPSLRAFLPHSE